MEETNSPLFFVSAGEPSGDLHAAELIRALRERYPQARFLGCGGSNMADAGCEILIPLTQIAVMGIGPVLVKLPRIWHYLRRIRSILQKERPDAVILVDFPGFNWQVAQRARQSGIPTIYFMPPQIWAWGQWRLKRMKRLIDCVLCPLEFEENWFNSKGIAVHRFGHPFFEEVRRRTLDASFLDEITCLTKASKQILTILPGSRDQEIRYNIADLLKTLEKVRASVPDVFPVIAAFKESQAERIRLELNRRKMTSVPVYVGRTPELISLASCCLAVSGSVSLELLANLKPTVIYYRIPKLSAQIFRFLCRVKYITLTNLIAVDRQSGESIFYSEDVRRIPSEPSERDRDLMVVPEYLVANDRSSDAASWLISWLSDESQRQAKVNELRDLLTATDQIEFPLTAAADRIVQFLQKRFEEKK